MLVPVACLINSFSDTIILEEHKRRYYGKNQSLQCIYNYQPTWDLLTESKCYYIIFISILNVLFFFLKGHSCQVQNLSKKLTCLEFVFLEKAFYTIC